MTPKHNMVKKGRGRKEKRCMCSVLATRDVLLLDLVEVLEDADEDLDALVELCLGHCERGREADDGAVGGLAQEAAVHEDEADLPRGERAVLG